VLLQILLDLTSRKLVKLINGCLKLISVIECVSVINIKS